MTKEQNEKAIQSWIKMLEKKHRVSINIVNGWYVAYRKTKEICRERDLCELDITLKYYLS